MSSTTWLSPTCLHNKNNSCSTNNNIQLRRANIQRLGNVSTAIAPDESTILSIYANPFSPPRRYRLQLHQVVRDRFLFLSSFTFSSNDGLLLVAFAMPSCHEQQTTIVHNYPRLHRVRCGMRIQTSLFPLLFVKQQQYMVLHIGHL
jgi:hypothetical protein